MGEWGGYMQAYSEFISKAWWSVVRHHIVPTTNDNTLGATNLYLVVSFMANIGMNIPWIIVEKIQDRGYSSIPYYLFLVSSHSH